MDLEISPATLTGIYIDGTSEGLGSVILYHLIALFFFVMLVLFFGFTGLQKKFREKKA
jgi:hypothetical protein